MTYNVHSCIGLDKKLSVDRIARVISRAKPDIIALQELDAGRKHKAGPNQAQRIAECLEMKFHYHPVYGSGSESFGNAVLSHLPFRVRQAECLPGYKLRSILECRGALWVEVECGGKIFHIINTHLSLWGRERMQQFKRLMSADWLLSPDLKDQVTVLCGDFNMTSQSAVYRTLTKDFRDAGLEGRHGQPLKTWTSRWPIRRLDYIFVRGHAGVLETSVPHSDLEIHASDHLPLIADFSL